jgi:hypothetical protein
LGLTSQILAISPVVTNLFFDMVGNSCLVSPPLDAVGRIAYGLIPNPRRPEFLPIL